MVNNLPDISCATVFPNDSLEHVSRDLIHITTVLSHCRDGHSLRVALHPKKDRHTLLHLQGLDRVSTLLTTGDHDDSTASTANAVTAQISPPYVVEAAIVSRDPRAVNALAYDLDPITPDDEDAALELLAGWAETRTKPFSEHLHDVVTIISHIARTQSSDDEIKAKAKILAFACLIHLRAIYKLRARLDAGRSGWGVSPINIIVQEARKGLDIGTYHPHRSEIALTEVEATFVTKAGILPSHGSTQEISRYKINQTTIGEWLQLLESTYQTIDTKAAPINLADDTFPADVARIINEMPLFQILVRHLVPALVSEPLATNLRSRYDNERTKASKRIEDRLSNHLDRTMQASASSATTGGLSGLPQGRTQEAPGNSRAEAPPVPEDLFPAIETAGTGDPAQHLSILRVVDFDNNLPVDEGTSADDPGEEDALLPEEGEDGRTHVTRYLQTLCAWWDAATRVFGHIPQGAPLRVAHVRVSRVTPHITSSTIGDFVNRYLGALDTYEHRARALAFFNSTGFTKASKRSTKGLYDLPVFNLPSEEAAGRLGQKASVHPEAALMGLMCLKRSDSPSHDMKGVENLFKARPTVIGVSKKCCRTCWLLSELLAEDDTNAYSSSVFLPGTHAMLYPWVPPTGIPLPILVKLRERLFSTFVRITCRHDTGLGSTQSSPTLSEGPEPVVKLRADDNLPSMLAPEEALLKAFL